LRNRTALPKNWGVRIEIREGFVIRRLGVGASLFVAVSLFAATEVAAQSGSSTTKPAARPPAAQTSKPATPQTATPATATAKPAGATPAAAASTAAPIIVVETERGTFEFETFPKEAPKTVAQVVALVKRNFYNGQRVHRVVPSFVIQFGDPNTRDFTKKALWGRGSSGKPIGAAEISPLHTHKVGAVAMAHGGDPSQADSQMYVILADTPKSRNLNGDYTVFGQVISGMSVVTATKEYDLIKRVTIKGETRPAK
jgi:cyclophilin family peptidyl-prolyl cis-trans isomerase